MILGDIMHDNDLIFGSDFFDLEESLTPNSDKLQLREGELREVAVLFADIRGFSSISNLFDAETVHNKMDEIMKLFSRCISFYGGFVDKYMGDGIMALFGAKKASEQDTERALLAALKMQQTLRMYNAHLNTQPGFETVELGVRVGINTGLVSVGKVGEDREGDFTVYGPEVNLASRMESNAPVNRIMLPAKTMKLVARNFEFEPAGLKTVKGFTEPIDCYLLIGPRLDSSLHRRNHGTRYIGRQAELDTLQKSLDSLPASRIPIVGIRGEAGLGKTRLVYEFELANESSVSFLHGASSAISPAPLNLFSSIFETLFRLQVNEEQSSKRQKLDQGFMALLTKADTEDKAELADIKPLIGFLLEIKIPDPRLKQSGADLLNFLSKAIDVFIQQIIKQAGKESKPLVMVLDDLHWIDEASAKVLENLVSKLSRLQDINRLLIVLMYRQDYKLPGYLSHLAEVQEIALQALSAEQTAALIANHTKGIQLSEDTINKVVKLSEGNPFFLEEWCYYIEDLPKDELKDFPVPANLYALIQTRLDKLPANLRMILHKASVIGQEFFVEILKHIEARLNDPIDVEKSLSGLEEHSLILKTLGFEYSTYFFKHITTREVAYQTILHENRKTLHRLCGEAIEELYAERLDEFCYELAEHYSKAELSDKALYYTEKAAASAARIYNNRQALELYGKILTLLSDQDRAKQLSIRMKVADIKWLIGLWKEAIQEAEQILSEACELKATTVCFDVHRFMGIAAFYQRNLEMSFSEFKQAMELAEQLPDPLLKSIATSNLGMWYYKNHEYELAKQLQLESLAIAEQIGETQRQTAALGNLGLICLDDKDFTAAEDYLQRSLELAKQHRYLKEQSSALGNLGWAMILQKDYASAMPYLSEKLKLSEDMNDLLNIINALGNMAIIHGELNQIPETIMCYERILQLRTYLGDEAAVQHLNDVIASLKNQD